MGLAGIQERALLDTGLHRHDKQWSQTGMGLAGNQYHCHSGVGLDGIQYLLVFPAEAGNQESINTGSTQRVPWPDKPIRG